MNMETNNAKHIDKLADKVGELAVSMATFTERIDSGFSGVHKRQDVANGRLSRLELDFNDLEEQQRKDRRNIKDLKSIHDAQNKTKKWLKREVVGRSIGILFGLLQAILLAYLVINR